MKLIRQNFRTFVFVALLSVVTSTITSCKDDPKDEVLGFGTITGTVTDDSDVPLPDVTVTVTNTDRSVTSDANGKFTIENIAIENHAVAAVFTKKGYQTTSVTVVAGKFDADKVAAITAKMVDASAAVTGLVLDGDKGNIPLGGVTVAIGSVKTTTGADGKFTLDGIPAAAHIVTFTKTDYQTSTFNVTVAMYDVNKIADVGTIIMGGKEILPGTTIGDLLGAGKWYGNEYKGGRNGQNYPQWDWSVDYMYTLDFWGNIEEQNEGTTLRIRNETADRSNPANMNVFDSYMYGVKRVTEDNKILSVYVRTHGASAEAPAHFGVQVVDLAAAEPVTVKVGSTYTHGSDSYDSYDFDLSAYVDKEVAVVVGIYRAQTGDYWKQLVLRRISFSKTGVNGDDWIGGTAVSGLENWKLPQETVRSIMPQTYTSFTGVSSTSGNRDNYYTAYAAWRHTNHIAANWTFMPVIKDPEVFAGEGYVIKTRGNGPINTIDPEAYFFAKFSIAPGKNTMTLKTRNFSSDATFFKLVAIDKNMVAKAMSPVSNTASSASAAADGCWKFVHQSGGTGSPNDYASFVYDLSEFDGEDVVLAIAVFNGEVNGTENKLVLYNINFN